MSEFKRIEHPVEFLNTQYYIDRFKVSYFVAKGMMAQTLSEEVFANDVYRVWISQEHATNRENWPNMRYVSVQRLDHTPVTSWADLQSIKNELIGPNYEAIEIYPSEHRLVDCGPQRHLWVFVDESFQIPMGWKTRRVQPYSGQEIVKCC